VAQLAIKAAIAKEKIVFFIVDIFIISAKIKLCPDFLKPGHNNFVKKPFLVSNSQFVIF
jgi:hypothetical protein